MRHKGQLCVIQQAAEVMHSAVHAGCQGLFPLAPGLLPATRLLTAPTLRHAPGTLLIPVLPPAPGLLPVPKTLQNTGTLTLMHLKSLPVWLMFPPVLRLLPAPRSPSALYILPFMPFKDPPTRLACLPCLLALLRSLQHMLAPDCLLASVHTLMDTPLVVMIQAVSVYPHQCLLLQQHTNHRPSHALALENPPQLHPTGQQFLLQQAVY